MQMKLPRHQIIALSSIILWREAFTKYETQPGITVGWSLRSFNYFQPSNLIQLSAESAPSENTSPPTFLSKITVLGRICPFYAGVSLYSIWLVFQLCVALQKLYAVDIHLRVTLSGKPGTTCCGMGPVFDSVAMGSSAITRSGASMVVVRVVWNVLNQGSIGLWE